MTKPYEATVEAGYDEGAVLIAELVYEDGDVVAAGHIFDPTEYEVFVLGMSQERTEQFAYELAEVKKILMALVEDDSLPGLTLSNQKIALADLAEAHEEIDRLNATITDLLEDMKKIAAPYPGVSSPPALERRLIAVKALQRNGVEF